MTSVKTNDVNFVRDMTTNAVINTNNVAYNMFKQNRLNLSSQAELGERMNNMEKQVDEIKNMLEKILKHVDSNS